MIKQVKIVDKVIKVQKAFLKFADMFDALPKRIRNELGNLIECRDGDGLPPGKVIDKAFREWLDGGRA